MTTMVELARLVYAMREAQKDYFEKRTRSALQEAKGLERRVDYTVLQILGDAVTAKQEELFSYPPSRFDD